MAPKRTPTSAAPAMSQAAIRKLVADSVATALEAQVVTMANTKNTTRNTGPRETPAAIRKLVADSVATALEAQVVTIGIHLASLLE
ncbi:hypothetical protein Tco_0180656 [Tanacetum coccineum]